MNGIEWSTVAANVGTFAMAALALFGGFWAIVSKQTKNLIRDTAVSNEVYERQQKMINDRLERVERSDAEFRVIKAQLGNVEKAVGDLKQDTKEAFEDQRREFNGGLVRIEQTMKDYTKAVMGKP
jgi:hypothetical protein